jgi:hypothetical protein
MYGLMNRNARAVVDAVRNIGDLTEYLRLRATVLSGSDVLSDAVFQSAYRKYWRMNAARLGDDFYSKYFTVLDQCRQTRRVDVAGIARVISDPAGLDHGLQFSFATKLAHMINPRLPVYDSFVASFFFYAAPSSDRPFEERLQKLLAFYAFLEREYERVLTHGLLSPAIAVFRNSLEIGSAVPDERIIDWLLWAWVSSLRHGAQFGGGCLYE